MRLQRLSNAHSFVSNSQAKGCLQPSQFVIRMNELIKTNQSHLNTKK
jgi:hypothetical protein